MEFHRLMDSLGCVHGESNSALPLNLMVEGGNHKPLDHARYVVISAGIAYI